MLVIRRMVDQQRAYTAIFLPGEPPRVFPTSDREHCRIMQIYKQDRPYPDIHNDFTEFEIGPAPVSLTPAPSRKREPRAGKKSMRPARRG